ncbi:MAG: tetratricopeptide repeat protein [Gammaproteobacteria bacterium]|nr:tetratricopeptide repeat protein [Gammaproteobacteria bacterium]
MMNTSAHNKAMRLYSAAACLGLLLLYIASLPAQAAGACAESVGRFVSIENTVHVKPTDSEDWQPADLNQSLCEGDTIRVAERSRTAVQLVNDAVLRLDENTTMRLLNVAGAEQEQSFLEVLGGAIKSFIRRPRSMSVSTPYLNGSIEGTEFLVEVTDDKSSILVFEGQVLAQNDAGDVQIQPGEMAVAGKGEAPRKQIVVSPRDAVQWALHYPAVLMWRDDAFPAAAQWSDAVKRSLQFYSAGHIEKAFASIADVRNTAADARFLVYRASLLLSVGRVEEARSDIERILSLAPGSNDALALRAIIAVAQNEKEKALEAATQATSSSPQSAAALIALSYAQQASFDLDAARTSIENAVQLEPENALAWARLAELQSSFGLLAEALEAATKAAEIEPRLSRTQTVLGFAHLMRVKTDPAKAAFNKAIALDQSDPLPRLGLGLAKISAGDLEAGRQDIDVAVGLDANHALLRAYLGKAYFEEKRYPLDEQQYSIAKQLDPNDPTAYFYSGILKQSINRPVEAVRDLDKSIELNDNRAVYRSRLLLDKDRAARSTSLARAYRDLGFTQLGINQSTESLAVDPSNASAHRFLSDIYLGKRRVEIARVSELLQAQLMQDININPIQPSVAETNLNIVTIGGPATPGFNEFTPLFEQNQAQLDVTGFTGNNNSYGGEAVATGLYDRFSFSAGGYYYTSDGWRRNNDLRQRIYNAYGQWAITPELNIQAEFRRRDSKEGDLAFNFDPDNFLRDQTIDRSQDTARVGLRYSPATSSNFLLSYIYSDIDEKSYQSEELSPFETLTTGSDATDNGYQIEGQYIYQRGRFNGIVGGAYSDTDFKSDDTISIVDVVFGPVFEVDETVKEDTKHSRGYLYTNTTYPESVTWTVGFSYDDYEEGPLDESSFNPKFGVLWNVKNDIRLRAAAFKTLKPALVNNRTIEPTQIAGFNQFFDDISTSQYWRYGGGFDWQLARDISLGGEITWRYIDEPLFQGSDDVIFEDRDEQFHNLYIYWTPMTQLAVKSEFVYDRYKADKGIATEFDNLPERVETISVPIAATWFSPSGLFAGLGGTYVNQDVDRSAFSTRGQGDDKFFLVDLAMGYRFPKRLGIVSLGVKNLFDTGIKYQDDSYRESRGEPATGPYFPERTIHGRVTLNF